MKPKAKQDDTLLDTWFRSAKNNPLIAALLFLAAVVAGIGGFWDNLPADWRASVCVYICKAPAPSPPPLNGWIWAGYLSGADTERWSVGPFVMVDKQSSAPDREWPFRAGDTIKILSDRNVVVYDFKNSGMHYVLEPPFAHEAVINPDADYTGKQLKAGELYLVMDVEVGGYPHDDKVVWLRVVPQTHG